MVLKKALNNYWQLFIEDTGVEPLSLEYSIMRASFYAGFIATLNEFNIHYNPDELSEFLYQTPPGVAEA